MKKYTVLIFIALFLFNNCSDNPVDVRIDYVGEVLKQVNIDSLTLSVEQLSGIVGISINGVPDTIKSRNSNFADNELAADYLMQKLQSYGLDVSQQKCCFAGGNVIATQPGTKYPDQSYIICAHYDCMPERDFAPGADDNASGTAAVLEAARILSSFESEYTIIYALWDEEEQGLLGSIHYAKSAKKNNDQILGVINIDMIGWDSDDDGAALISFQSVANSRDIANHAFELAGQYQLDLNPVVVEFSLSSDNRAFWENGYSAIAISEHAGDDFNAHYHTINDQLQNFNIDYFHNCSKLAIGTLAYFVALSGE